MPEMLENSAMTTGLENVFIPLPKKGSAKECSNYCTIEFISHANKVMLKNFQARLQQYMNEKLQKYKLGFEEAEEDIKFPVSVRSWRKQRSSRKHLLLLC